MELIALDLSVVRSYSQSCIRDDIERPNICRHIKQMSCVYGIIIEEI